MEAPTKLFVELHISYIQSLDKVSSSCSPPQAPS